VTARDNAVIPDLEQISDSCTRGGLSGFLAHPASIPRAKNMVRNKECCAPPQSMWSQFSPLLYFLLAPFRRCVAWLNLTSWNIDEAMAK